MHLSKVQNRKHWARESFRGLQNVLVPSFTVDQTRLSAPGIKFDVQRSIAHGFFATLCACDAGLTLDENKQFIEIAAAEAAGKLLVGVSLFLDNEAQMRELAQHAEKVGCSYLLLGFPLLFNPGSEDDAYLFARRICEASSLAIVLPAERERTDFTRFHPSGVPFGMFDRLVQLDNVAAILVGTSEPGVISECFSRYRDHVLVSATFFGMLPLLVNAWGMQWSGGGFYEALQSPEQPQAIEFFELLLKRRNSQAMQLFWRMAPGMAALGQLQGEFSLGGAEHYPLRKFYQWCTGGNGGLPREPTLPLAQRQRDLVREAYHAMGIVQTSDADDNFPIGRANYGLSLRG